jgi:hypothetical protein
MKIPGDNHELILPQSKINCNNICLDAK